MSKGVAGASMETRPGGRMGAPVLGLLLILLGFAFTASFRDPVVVKYAALLILAPLAFSMVSIASPLRLACGVRWVYGLWMTSIWISTFWSAYPHVAWHAARAKIAAMLLLPVAAKCTADAIMRKRLAGLLLFIGAGVALLALVQRLGVSFLGNEYSSTIGHTNFFAQFMMIMVFLSLGECAAHRTHRGVQYAWLLYAMAGLWMLCLAGSRGALLGLAGGALLVSMMLLYRKVDVPRRQLAFRLLAASVLLLVFAAMLARYTGRISTVRFRLYMYQAALRIILDKPVLGYGAGGFQLHARDYLSAAFFHDETMRGLADPGVTLSSHVHQELLEIGVEQGVTGMLLFLLLCFLIVRTVAKSARAEAVIDARMLAIFGAWGGLLSSAMVSSGMRHVTLDAMFCVLSGMLLSKTVTARQTRYAKTAVVVTSFGLLLWLSWYGCRYLQAETMVRDVLDHADASKAQQAGGVAWQIYPRVEYLHMRAEAYRRLADWDRLEATMKRINAVHPAYPSALYLESYLYTERNALKQARRKLTQAYRFDPYGVRLRLLDARLALREGEFEAAETVIRAAWDQAAREDEKVRILFNALMGQGRAWEAFNMLLVNWNHRPDGFATIQTRLLEPHVSFPAKWTDLPAYVDRTKLKSLVALSRFVEGRREDARAIMAERFRHGEEQPEDYLSRIAFDAHDIVRLTSDVNLLRDSELGKNRHIDRYLLLHQAVIHGKAGRYQAMSDLLQKLLHDRRDLQSVRFETPTFLFQPDAIRAWAACLLGLCRIHQGREQDGLRLIARSWQAIDPMLTASWTSGDGRIVVEWRRVWQSWDGCFTW